MSLLSQSYHRATLRVRDWTGEEGIFLTLQLERFFYIYILMQCRAILFLSPYQMDSVAKLTRMWIASAQMD